MKTDTKLKLVKIIREKGAMRPTDLSRLLSITPQALHRQLKNLVLEGILVSQGSPPTTRYALAGVPDFTKAFDWISTPTLKRNPLQTVCETRDILTGRLSPLKDLIKKGLNPQALPLLISTAGEIGNNSFDHNLGQWRDVPGCWFETQVTGNRVWMCIADRGQGIFNSLVKVDAKIPNDQAALEVAFEKFISGRSPEQRGNGLKFVKKNILIEKERGLACLSGKGSLHFGDWGEDCDQVLKETLSKVKGTITLMAWRIG